MEYILAYKIVKSLEFIDQMRVRRCSKFLYERIRIEYIPKIYHDRLIDEGIKNLSQLQALNLDRNEKITDEGIKNLSQLQTLNLNYNKKITDEGIKNLSQLQTLNLSCNNKITDEGIKNLRSSCKIIW